MSKTETKKVVSNLVYVYQELVYHIYYLFSVMYNCVAEIVCTACEGRINNKVIGTQRENNIKARDFGI
jgi:hypothetical protein